ncbi:MAG: Ig-like domain-containing protein [Acidimicrobiales bacterium]
MGQTASATVTVTVDPPAAPSAVDDAYETPFETPKTVDAPGIVGNDSGTGIEVGSYEQPAHGTVTVEADGSLTYTPDDGFAGVDVTYAIVDEVGQTAERPSPSPSGCPTARGRRRRAHPDDVAAHRGPRRPGQRRRPWIVVDHTARPGGVAILLDGRSSTPAAGFTGVDTFTYEIADAFTSGPATVTIRSAPAGPRGRRRRASTAYQTPWWSTPRHLGQRQRHGHRAQPYGSPATAP